MTSAREWTAAAWTAIGGDSTLLDTLVFRGEGCLPSAYAVTDFASAAIATAALSVAELLGHRGKLPEVTVDRRLASFWFNWSLRPLGWSRPPERDPIAGDYRAADGWIRVHTNAPHHRAAAERVLGPQTDHETMAHAIAPWAKRDLESAIVEAGGCEAEMRSSDEWARHPQGMAVAAEPLVHIAAAGAAPELKLTSSARPLEGLRVLDLTRVLAGPVATRFLAGYGAEVLRIDPPTWDEPGIVPEVTLGKRCARLDLHDSRDRAVFETLLSQADILLHGYRSDALARLGYDAATRGTLRPGLIDVSLDAYGWSGPWASRRGFDSLVQMSSGIADTGMRRYHADHPVPLPVQALDHATGYLLAATAIKAVSARLTQGFGTQARLSLARTARFLVDGDDGSGAIERMPCAPESANDLAADVETTGWGPARRVLPPVVVALAPMSWRYPANALGSSTASWP